MPSPCRPFTVLACDQRSGAGRLTGSRAFAAFGTTKAGQWSANRKDLKVQLVLERLTGQPQERAVGGYEVRDGIARAPLAKFAYECAQGVILHDVGFVSDNEIPIGCSPDAVIGDFEGLVSVKAPKASTHLATLQAYHAWQRRIREAGRLANSNARVAAHLAISLDKPWVKLIPEEYRFQIIHELYCTGADWCEYMSYHPDFASHGLDSVIVRVTRDDFHLDEYETLVREFLAEVDADYELVLEMAS